MKLQEELQVMKDLEEVSCSGSNEEELGIGSVSEKSLIEEEFEEERKETRE